MVWHLGCLLSARFALGERFERRPPKHLIDQALAPWSGMDPAGCRGVSGPVPRPLWMSALSTTGSTAPPRPHVKTRLLSANIVTVMLTGRHQEERRCLWCGQRFALNPGPGRPRRYCRPSHRQRAYESRRLARAHALGAGQALVSLERLGAVRDLLYRIEAALDDVEADLAQDPEATGEALSHLLAACTEARILSLEPLAVGTDIKSG